MGIGLYWTGNVVILDKLAFGEMSGIMGGSGVTLIVWVGRDEGGIKEEAILGCYIGSSAIDS